MSPLLAAVDRNDLKSFELCKHNDLFNVKNKNGKTALILAAERRNEEIVRSLQSEGEQVIETEAQDVSQVFVVQCRVIDTLSFSWFVVLFSPLFLYRFSILINSLLCWFLYLLSLGPWTDCTSCCSEVRLH